MKIGRVLWAPEPKKWIFRDVAEEKCERCSISRCDPPLVAHRSKRHLSPQLPVQVPDFSVFIWLSYSQKSEQTDLTGCGTAGAGRLPLTGGKGPAVKYSTPFARSRCDTKQRRTSPPHSRREHIHFLRAPHRKTRSATTPGKNISTKVSSQRYF